MLPLPSTLRNVLLLGPLLGVLVRVAGKLITRFEDGYGVVPSGLEAGEVGTVSYLVAVLRPVLIVSLCRSVRYFCRGRGGNVNEKKGWCWQGRLKAVS